MNKNNKHYFLIAGEASGDLHGSKLIHHLKQIHSSSIFSGIGGPNMEEAGLQSMVSIEKLSVMGFWEVIKQIGFFLTLQKNVLHEIKTNKPDVIILIDYPGFNLRLAKKIKKLANIPIIYYISPQVWAWKENRIVNIKKYIDSLIVIFPFEVSWFQSKNINVEYFGHPLIDRLIKNQNMINHPRTGPTTIGFFPGSRKQELEKHLPVFKTIIDNANSINANVQFIISRAPLMPPSYFAFFNKNNIPVVSDPLYQTFSKCDIAIVASGTATLECAISSTPFIAIYKMSTLSWLITKYVVKLKFASIVNILSNKEIVPELIQKDFHSKNVIKKINYLLQTINYNQAIVELNKVTQNLGTGDTYKKTSEFISSFKV